MKKILLVVFALGCFVLMACNSLYEQEPVGVGRDYSELKKSPCACLELKKAPQLPEWMV